MRILVIDDEPNIRKAFTFAMESMGHEVDAVSTGSAALKAAEAHGAEVAFLDLKLCKDSGLDVLDALLKGSPNMAVIIVTAFASIETAVEAMRRGAFDYLAKPCTPEQIRQVLARITRTRRLEGRVAELETRLRAEGPEADLQTNSPTMQKAIQVALKAAESDAIILLLGESGTGKSVLARAVHQHSPRHANPFVTVSCPSLSRELLESELFGHIKGAFTGAVADTWGKVAAADGGTLFLDEIGDLPLEIQAKLLRLLQEREYERVGEAKSRRANVRVVAATNRNLKQEVAEGKFREDLYYRLNVITITVPPLRERVADISRLANHLLAFFNAHAGKRATGFAPEALKALEAYSWPGNLRELRNIIERSVILSAGEQIQVEDLSEIIQTVSEIRLGGNVTLVQIEDEHIRRVIANTKSLEEAAHMLGIDPATLYRRRKKMV